MKHILIIMGSVRPVRICEQVARWALETASHDAAFTFEVVDLKDWCLPMDDEPDQPAHGSYIQTHTKAWSEKIKTGDGFIFVTPQYNWGYPAALKNALDHLYYEWKGKPAAVISYGHRGGVRASEQLRQVLTGLHMHIAPTTPGLVFNHGQLAHDGRVADPAGAFRSYEPLVKQAVQEMLDFYSAAHRDAP